MSNIKPIIFIIGILLIFLGVAMFAAAMVEFVMLDEALRSAAGQNWQVFSVSALFTSMSGLVMVMVVDKDDITDRNLSNKQAFILTSAAWLVLVGFAAIPLMFSSLQLGYVDAFFEAMSGLTTTGATILAGLDETPPSVLFWRALLQWLGGIGIIVVALAILPMLKIGGMQLFRSEFSDRSEKILPSAKEIALNIMAVYIFLTALCAVVMYINGMSVFDAICHSMTTLSTAGFSTHDASIGYFDSAALEWSIIFFLIAASLPYVLYINAIQKGNLSGLLRIVNDSQVRWFLMILFSAIAIMTYWLNSRAIYNDGWEALRYAAFNVTSIMTTTGYVSTDYYLWGGFSVLAMLAIAFIGGCTGSTVGSVKVFRFQMLYKIARMQIRRLTHPHGVFPIRFNGKAVSDSTLTSVVSFVVLFLFCFITVSLLLSLMGADYITAMSGAISTLGNVGPGLGEIIGPSGNYSSLPDLSKWVLSFAMLIGRLELLTVLILFSPYFWKE